MRGWNFSGFFVALTEQHWGDLSVSQVNPSVLASAFIADTHAASRQIFRQMLQTLRDAPDALFGVAQTAE